jgi:hypothetical protein
MVSYSLASGALGLAGGAAVSLITSGRLRIIIWCAVAGAICVAAGLVYSTASVNSFWSAGLRYLRRFGDL